jgi:hypothetical protein
MTDPQTVPPEVGEQVLEQSLVARVEDAAS